MVKSIPWNDPQALRALAEMQRKIAEKMTDLACKVIMEGVAADTERQLRAAEITELFENIKRKMDGGGTREAAQMNSPPKD